MIFTSAPLVFYFLLIFCSSAFQEAESSPVGYFYEASYSLARFKVSKNLCLALFCSSSFLSFS